MSESIKESGKEFILMSLDFFNDKVGSEVLIILTFLLSSIVGQLGNDQETRSKLIEQLTGMLEVDNKDEYKKLKSYLQGMYDAEEEEEQNIDKLEDLDLSDIKIEKVGMMH